MTDVTGAFWTSVRVQQIGGMANEGGAAIRIGVKSELNEYRSNCFVQHGIDAGVLRGRIVLGPDSEPLPRVGQAGDYVLELAGEPGARSYTLVLTVRSGTTGEKLGSISREVPSDEVIGNIAIVSNFSHASEVSAAGEGSRYRFKSWQLDGSAILDTPAQRFGPILWAMYTLDDTRTEEGFVVKLSVLTGPMGSQDSNEVELEVRRGGRWVSLGSSRLDHDAWVAVFRVPRWDAKEDVPYRLVYRERLREGRFEADVYEGTIKANPSGQTLRMAALTCQNDYAFPYEPVVNNLLALKPDLLYFSGDQIYEDHGGFGVIRAPADRAILNYLRKFYQFGWAFRETMRHAPTVCLPDDHDVLQGNLWGEGGAPMAPAAVATGRTDAAGGYVEPARVINAIHRTNVAHLPDPVDPSPAKQGISVYYTKLVFGGVGFAILGDRQWKSGPEELGIIVGETGQNEPPTYVNPAYDRADLDLLGKRQEEFLDRWGADWRGHRLKAVLSQTLFACVSTHQPEPDRYLKCDFDSSGWPHSARNRAVRLMQQAKALHICGDTHLASLVQYGVEQQHDGNWAFCTPAIAAGWPRWWLPEKVGLPVGKRPAHGLANTGEYSDCFGNPVYVYAVGNPKVGTEPHRYLKAHQKGSGFGFVEFDTLNLTYRLSAFTFLGNALLRDGTGQFPGWPVTITQDGTTIS
ncbi:alkaline phosphatase D family protein [Tsuneonella mangrovi]|uniref:alkaline phosphatase D family protein n=1 Tax=Tsuneonella mangrovi TaxID=1982042 RepID=UPI00196AD233|nr:alkaline phosphatase D family protein [Tsuneonella mangrovi]